MLGAMNTLKIGWAGRDISTDRPVDNPGQFHIQVSRGVSDPITATALALEGDADPAILVSADLIAIRPPLLEEVRAAVAARIPGFPVEKLLLNATHTHTGASYSGAIAGMATPSQVPHEGIEIASSDEYRAFLVARIAEAAAEAWARRAPGGMTYGYGYAVVGHSRRTVYFDDVSKRPGAAGRPGMNVAGHAVMYGNTDDPRFSHYEAGADATVNLLYTFDTAGRLTGAVINVPCPSQNSEHEWQLSADYWHDVRVEIRRRHGDIFLLPQCAAAGDLAPRVLHGKAAQDRRFRLQYGADDLASQRERIARRDIARRIAAAFDETLEWSRKDVRSDAPLRHTVRTIALQRRFITKTEYTAHLRELRRLEAEPFARAGTPEERLVHDSTLVARRNRCRRVLERYAEQAGRPRLPMELHTIRLGDVAFVSNPFELYMDFMHRIQARSPFIQTFVVQLCGVLPDGADGYLATERGVRGKGYSASLYCNRVSPRGGQELVDATVAALKEIYSGAAPRRDQI